MIRQMISLALPAVLLACLFELWRLLRTARVEIARTAEQARIVMSKAFQALDTAHEAAEHLEDAAGDIAETTEEAKQRSKKGVLGWLAGK